MERTTMLIAVWGIIIPIITLIILMPSFSGGGSIFSPSEKVVLDIKLHRPLALFKVSIEDVKATVQGGFIVFNRNTYVEIPWGGVDYNVIVTDNQNGNIVTKTVKLKRGETADVLISYPVQSGSGLHKINIKVVKADNGDLQYETNTEVSV